MTSPTRRAERCYLSTPEHGRRFYGKYIYIYTDKGSLELSDGQLRFRSTKRSLDIDIKSIVELRVGSFNRVAKPTRLDRLEVTYQTCPEETHTLYLVPTRSAFTPTWTTNAIVREWMSWLEKRRSTRL